VWFGDCKISFSFEFHKWEGKFMKLAEENIIAIDV
jgi:hypothetical protein